VLRHKPIRRCASVVCFDGLDVSEDDDAVLAALLGDVHRAVGHGHKSHTGAIQMQVTLLIIVMFMQAAIVVACLPVLVCD